MSNTINIENIIYTIYDLSKNTDETRKNELLNTLLNLTNKFFINYNTLSQSNSLKNQQSHIINLSLQNHEIDVTQIVSMISSEIFNTLSQIQKYCLNIEYPLLKNPLDIFNTIEENSNTGLLNMNIEQFCSWAFIQKINGRQQLPGLVEIVLFCAQQDGETIAKYIQNFKIQDPSALIEIAKLCAQQNGEKTAKYIQNFRIQDPSALIEIAKLCAQQNAVEATRYIEHFGIQDPSALIEIAMLYAPQGGMLHIDKFKIQDQSALIRIAKLCFLENMETTLISIQKFKIQHQSALIEMATFCAKKDGKITAEYIHNFRIDNDQQLRQIQAICIIQSPLALEHIKDFDSTSLIKSIQQENPYQLLHQLEEKLAPFCFNQNSNFSKFIDMLKNRPSHVQLQTGKWLVSLLYAFIFAFQENPKIALIQSPLIQALGKLNHPELRSYLTIEIAKLSQDDTSLALISNIGISNPKSKNQQPASPERCALNFVLYLLQASGVSRKALGPIEKHFPALFKHSKMLTLIELLYRLHSSPHLTSRDKETILIMLNGKQEDNKKTKTDKVYSLLVILFLEEESGLVQQNGISSYALRIFQEKFLLGNKIVDVEQLLHYFSPNRHPSALFVYAAQLATLKDPDIMKDLSRYIISVLDRRFKEERFTLDNNIHLRKLAHEHSDVLALWQQALDPIKTTLTACLSQETSFDAISWLREKLIIDRHMDLDTIPNIQALFQGEDIAQQSLSSLECSLHKLIIATTSQEQRKAFDEIQKQLKNNQFKLDVKEQIIVLGRKAYTASETVTVADSEDYLDLLLAGTEVIGSCQNVNGSADLNKGLLGYILDAKNRLVVIKNTAGQIMARAKLSLLLDEDNNPVLFLERIYTQNRYEEQCIALLIEVAQQKASILNIPLTALKTDKNKEKKVYNKNLIALESGVSYEYSDAVRGICPQGHYRIPKNETVVLYEKTQNSE